MSPLPPTAAAGSGRTLESFRDDAVGLPTEAFEARHGSAFLLLSAIRPHAPEDTSSTHLALLGDEEGNTGALTTWVFALRSAQHVITLGRARDGDVVIPDRSVSRRHALIKREADGRLLVLDAGSSNGTSINGRNVLTRGAGAPTPLAPGDTLRLGSLEFTCAHAAALREMAAKGR